MFFSKKFRVKNKPVTTTEFSNFIVENSGEAAKLMIEFFTNTPDLQSFELLRSIKNNMSGAHLIITAHECAKAFTHIQLSKVRERQALENLWEAINKSFAEFQGVSKLQLEAIRQAFAAYHVLIQKEYRVKKDPNVITAYATQSVRLAINYLACEYLDNPYDASGDVEYSIDHTMISNVMAGAYFEIEKAIDILELSYG